MEGTSKRFIIPVYQRNYDWRKENCKQLFDDLVKTITDDRKAHFFGSIVSVYNPDGYSEEHQIIDGQQRLTTTSLLLLAIHNLIKQGKIVPEEKQLADKIYRTFLVDEYASEETRIKLKPVLNDHQAFVKLFDNESEYIPNSNVTINYQYFYDRILQKRELSVDDLFKAIQRLEIIGIELNPAYDNPQLIFESLNSTGLALTESDKIRNFILMGQSTKNQELFYENYWNAIEQNVQYQTDWFIRDYLSVKTQKTPKISNTYFTFKSYVEDKNLETQDLLGDLKHYSKFYKILLGSSDNEELASCIDRLNRLETTTTRPFFLEALQLRYENLLSDDELVQIFQITEAYIFRRQICECATNTLNKIFLTLHKEIVRFDGTTENYLEKFKYALTSKQGRSRFPQDKEFIEAFSTKPIYRQMKGKNQKYLFERLENYGTKETKNVFEHLENGDYSIEHIMPQTLNAAWKKELGENYLQTHELWLHRIANLTLTAYNAKYSNYTFKDKREMQNGFQSSGIRMNQLIAQKERWGEPELQERDQLLRERALQIWSYPKTAYTCLQNDEVSYSLEDDKDYTGHKIQRFSFKNTERTVRNWTDMFEQVVRLLHSDDKSVIIKLAHSSKTSFKSLAPYFSTKTIALREHLEIEPNLYVERNTSTQTKINILRLLFKLYADVEPNDLLFYLRENAENSTEEEEEEEKKDVKE